MLSPDQVEDIVAGTAAAVGSAAVQAAGLTPMQSQLLLSVLDRALRERLAAVTAVRIEAESVSFADNRPDRA